MKTFKIVFLLSLLIWISSFSLFAQQIEKINAQDEINFNNSYHQSFNWKSQNIDDHIIIIGQPSLLGKTLAKGKDVKVKMDGSPSEKPETDEKLINLVKSANAIVVDLNNIKHKIGEDRYIQVAMAHSVPIILENIKSEEMAALVGIGVKDEGIAIVINYNDRNGAKIVVLSEENSSGLEKSEIEEYAPPLTEEMKERMKKDNIKMEDIERENRALRNKIESIDNSTNTQRNVIEIAKDVLESVEISKQELRENIKLNRDGSLRNERRKSGGPNEGSFGIPNIPMPYALQNNTTPDPFDFSRAIYEYTTQMTWKIGNQELKQYLDLEIEVIAAISPEYKKFVRIRPKNTSYFTPGTMTIDDEFDRGYYQSACHLKFTYVGANGSTFDIDNYAPLNTSRLTTFSHTTGFSVSTGGDIGSTATLGITYDERETRSTTVADFEVVTEHRNENNNVYANFKFDMGLSTRDLWDNDCFHCKPRVHNPPDLATGQLTPNCEVVFTAPGDYFGQKTVKIDTYHKGHRIWSNKNPWYYYYWSRYYWRTLSRSFNIDFSRVSYPHLAIDKTVSNSSTYYSWDKSRVVDGYTQPRGTNHGAATAYQNNPYFDIDLGSSQYILDIDIWNVVPYRYHLQDYYVFISNSPFTSTDPNVTKSQSGVAAKFHTGRSPRVKKFDIDRTGRYIRIQRVINGGWLFIGEIAVNPRRSPSSN